MAVAAIVLAAGASVRMGQPKQLLQIEGEPLLRRVARIVCSSSAHPVIVVLGARSEVILPEIAALPLLTIQNERWAEGQGSSLARAFDVLSTEFPNTEAAVVILCDQVNLTSGVIDELIATWRTTSKGIVACEYAGTIGAPTLFSGHYFPLLRSLHGDVGARSILSSAPNDLAKIPFPGGAVDLDTPADVDLWNRQPRNQIKEHES